MASVCTALARAEDKFMAGEGGFAPLSCTPFPSNEAALSRAGTRTTYFTVNICCTAPWNTETKLPYIKSPYHCTQTRVSGISGHIKVMIIQ
jgi:hypothetical protein